MHFSACYIKAVLPACIHTVIPDHRKMKLKKGEIKKNIRANLVSALSFYKLKLGAVICVTV